jgi:hypothetical protein
MDTAVTFSFPATQCVQTARQGPNMAAGAATYPRPKIITTARGNPWCLHRNPTGITIPETKGTV